MITSCNDSIVEAWIVVAPIPLHSLTQLGERLANHLELSLVVVLAPVPWQEWRKSTYFPYLVVWSAAILARFLTAPSNWVLKVVNICTSLSTNSWDPELDISSFPNGDLVKGFVGDGDCWEVCSSHERILQNCQVHRKARKTNAISLNVVNSLCGALPFQPFSSHFSNAFHPCKLENGSTPGQSQMSQREFQPTSDWERTGCLHIRSTKLCSWFMRCSMNSSSYRPENTKGG